MSDDRLTYLHDHLAGARFAIELLKELSQQEVDADASSLAARLLEDITADRAALEELVKTMGGDSKSAKDVASWIAEKAARFKLDMKTRLGIFEAVELLCLGVQGKLALWNALASSAGQASVELERLQLRANEQHAELEQMRLTLAAAVLRGWDLQAECVQKESMLQRWAEAHGIELDTHVFAPGKAGEFDGTTISINSTYGHEERFYYALHAIGSIVIWSHDRDGVQRLFDELRDAKKEKPAAPERLCKAIERYRAFELESSAYAVWIMGQVGAESLVAPYSNFMRADVEAMTEFHKTGKAPVWKDFFASWNAEVAAGRRCTADFSPKEAAGFHAIPIETQQILQQQ